MKLGLGKKDKNQVGKVGQEGIEEEMRREEREELLR
jgi:hypothetical protein